MLRLVAKDEAPDDVRESLAVFQRMVRDGDITRFVIMYEDVEESMGWVATDFPNKAAQMGFIELVKLRLFQVGWDDV